MLTCDGCGKTDETVQETTDPYAEEINDTIVHVTWCETCWREAADDI